MRNQRVHGHVIVHLDPPIDKKKGMVTWGVTVHASGSLCVWLELLGSNQFGTSDKRINDLRASGRGELRPIGSIAVGFGDIRSQRSP